MAVSVDWDRPHVLNEQWGWGGQSRGLKTGSVPLGKTLMSSHYCQLGLAPSRQSPQQTTDLPGRCTSDFLKATQNSGNLRWGKCYIMETFFAFQGFLG